MVFDDFHTSITIKKADTSISVNSGVLFMGSCFAENIGNIMAGNRFPVMINPHGILYNPSSIATSLKQILANSPINENELSFLNDLWHSFMHHGRFSQPEAAETVRLINEATNRAHQFILKCHFIVITLGTAMVYEHKETGRVVANCHKFPPQTFNRYRLNIDEITTELKEAIISLRSLNPKINIILSVSPIRHLKDGANVNQLSKATLLLAVNRLTSLFENISYFPAYEIMMDELRDYRFYDAGMTHPSDTAIKYIWKRFSETYLTNDARSFTLEAEKIVKTRNHRPSNVNSPAYRDFLFKALEATNSLSQRYPEALLENDKEWFQAQLNQLS
jgi:hypothetical protein